MNDVKTEKEIFNFAQQEMSKYKIELIYPRNEVKRIKKDLKTLFRLLSDVTKDKIEIEIKELSLWRSYIFIGRELGNLEEAILIKNKEREVVFRSTPYLTQTTDEAPDLVEDTLKIITKRLNRDSLLSLKRVAKSYSSIQVTKGETSKHVQTHTMNNLRKFYSLKEIAYLFIISPKIVLACYDLGLDENKNVVPVYNVYSEYPKSGMLGFANVMGTVNTMLAIINYKGKKLSYYENAEYYNLNDLIMDEMYGLKSPPPKSKLSKKEQWKALVKSSPNKMRELYERGLTTLCYLGKNLLTEYLRGLREEEENRAQYVWLCNLPKIDENFELTIYDMYNRVGLSTQNLTPILLNPKLLSEDDILKFFKYLLLIDQSEITTLFATFIVEKGYDISMIEDISCKLFEKPDAINVLKSSEITAPIVNTIEEKYLTEKRYPSWKMTTFECKKDKAKELVKMFRSLEGGKDLLMIDYDKNSTNLYAIVPSSNYVFIDYISLLLLEEKPKQKKVELKIKPLYRELLKQKLIKSFPSFTLEFEDNKSYFYVKSYRNISKHIQDLANEFKEDIIKDRNHFIRDLSPGYDIRKEFGYSIEWNLERTLGESFKVYVNNKEILIYSELGFGNSYEDVKKILEYFLNEDGDLYTHLIYTDTVTKEDEQLETIISNYIYNKYSLSCNVKIQEGLIAIQSDYDFIFEIDENKLVKRLPVFRSEQRKKSESSSETSIEESDEESEKEELRPAKKGPNVISRPGSPVKRSRSPNYEIEESSYSEEEY